MKILIFTSLLFLSQGVQNRYFLSMDVAFNLPTEIVTSKIIDEKQIQEIQFDYPVLLSVHDSKNDKQYTQRLQWSEVYGRMMQIKYCKKSLYETQMKSIQNFNLKNNDQLVQDSCVDDYKNTHIYTSFANGPLFITPSQKNFPKYCLFAQKQNYELQVNMVDDIQQYDEQLKQLQDEQTQITNGILQKYEILEDPKEIIKEIEIRMEKLYNLKKKISDNEKILEKIQHEFKEVDDKEYKKNLEKIMEQKIKSENQLKELLDYSSLDQNEIIKQKIEELKVDLKNQSFDLQTNLTYQNIKNQQENWKDQIYQAQKMINIFKKQKQEFIEKGEQQILILREEIQKLYKESNEFSDLQQVITDVSQDMSDNNINIAAKIKTKEEYVQKILIRVNQSLQEQQGNINKLKEEIYKNEQKIQNHEQILGQLEQIYKQKLREYNHLVFQYNISSIMSYAEQSLEDLMIKKFDLINHFENQIQDRNLIKLFYQLGQSSFATDRNQHLYFQSCQIDPQTQGFRDLSVDIKVGEKGTYLLLIDENINLVKKNKHQKKSLQKLFNKSNLKINIKVDQNQLTYSQDQETSNFAVDFKEDYKFFIYYCLFKNDVVTSKYLHPLGEYIMQQICIPYVYSDYSTDLKTYQDQQEINLRGWDIKNDQMQVIMEGIQSQDLIVDEVEKTVNLLLYQKTTVYQQEKEFLQIHHSEGAPQIQIHKSQRVSIKNLNNFEMNDLYEHLKKVQTEQFKQNWIIQLIQEKGINFIHFYSLLMIQMFMLLYFIRGQNTIDISLEKLSIYSENLEIKSKMEFLKEQMKNQTFFDVLLNQDQDFCFGTLRNQNERELYDEIDTDSCGVYCGDYWKVCFENIKTYQILMLGIPLGFYYTNYTIFTLRSNSSYTLDQYWFICKECYIYIPFNYPKKSIVKEFEEKNFYTEEQYQQYKDETLAEMEKRHQIKKKDFESESKMLKEKFKSKAIEEQIKQERAKMQELKLQTKKLGGETDTIKEKKENSSAILEDLQKQKSEIQDESKLRERKLMQIDFNDEVFGESRIDMIEQYLLGTDSLMTTVQKSMKAIVQDSYKLKLMNLALYFLSSKDYQKKRLYEMIAVPNKVLRDQRFDLFKKNLNLNFFEAKTNMTKLNSRELYTFIQSENPIKLHEKIQKGENLISNLISQRGSELL